eukprot:m.22002 g.22002  ORF g.22002 m.22002 type:complete len:129 (-) comp5409_c0_seq1:173-559(-)
MNKSKPVRQQGAVVKLPSIFSNQASQQHSQLKKKGTSREEDELSHEELQNIETATMSELELVEAMKEQVELQKKLLQYEYEQEAGERAGLTDVELADAYDKTRRAIKTAHSASRGKKSSTPSHSMGAL